MTSEAVKVERIKRKVERERLLLEFGRDTLKTALESDVLALLVGWMVVEALQNTRAPWADPSRPTNDPATHWIGPYAAAALQVAMTTGFGLNGFNKLVKS